LSAELEHELALNGQLIATPCGMRQECQAAKKFGNIVMRIETTV
jgi:hypothetical protein